jgi:hypothetical protein
VLALEQHAHPVQAEQIAPLEQARAVLHLGDFHSPGVRGSNERADARSRNDGGLDSDFFQCAKNANVREAFQPAAPEHERDLVRLASLLGGRCSFQAAWSLAGHAKV